MSQITLVLLWLGTSSSYLYLQSDLDAWSRSRQVALAPPKVSRSLALNYEPALVDALEQRLEQARIMAASGDDAGALQTLSNVDAELVAHAELPQAAWLMSERLRLEAHVHQAHPERAQLTQELLRAATILDTRPETAALPIRGVGPRDLVYVDARSASDLVRIAPGRHHVRVTRDDVPIWADWVVLSAASSVLELPVPRPEPCTREDLAVVVDGNRVNVAAPVLCPNWAVARPRSGGGIEVATCRYARCGPLLPWQRSLGDLYVGPPQTVVEEKPRWPLFVVAGVSAALATSIVLWQAGVFDRDAGPSFVVNARGPDPEANVRSDK